MTIGLFKIVVILGFLAATLSATTPDTLFKAQSIDATADTLFKAQSIDAIEPETDVSYYIMILTLIGVCVFARPQIYTDRSYYVNCFNTKGYMWTYLLNPTAIDWISRVMDAVLAISFGRFLLLRQDPVDPVDKNYYMGINALFIVYLILKWLWRDLFYNNWDNKRAFVLCITLKFLSWAVLVILVVLIAIQFEWGSFGALLIVLLWSTFLFCITCYIYACLHGKLIEQTMENGIPSSTCPQTKKSSFRQVI